VERVDVSSDAVPLLEQNSAGANLVDGSGAVGLDRELAVAERAHHPMDVGVDDNTLADEVGIRHPAEGHHGILPLPPSPAVLTTVEGVSSTGFSTPWPYTGPRRPPRPLSVATQPAAQGRRPFRFRNAQGDLLEVYYIGELAARLGKSSHTIRRWEREGVLPATPFEQRVRRRPARRLYPLHWIEGVVAIAEDEGLVGRKPACMKNTHFTARARELHRRLFG